MKKAETDRYPVNLMCRCLQVSRSGFYAWCSRQGQLSPRQAYWQYIDELVLYYFERSRRTYGAPRILADFKADGIDVNVKTIAKSMRRLGIEGCSTRKYRTNKTLAAKQLAHKDHCQRVWDQGALDMVWITDFTYLWAGEGWVYLCAIRDAHSRRVVGYAMGDRQTTSLVLEALKQARHCRGRLPKQLVLHADRGAQFTSDILAGFAKTHGMKLSMGKTGVCWDNAMAESFWATLKVEYFYRYVFTSRDQVYEGVSDWIEVFYNRHRRHSALGHQTPVEFELKQQRLALAS